MLRRLAPRRSPFNRVDHTLPQIPRTSLGHGASPASRITPRLCRFATHGNPDSNPTGTALVFRL
jgi:hypothetical protein